MKKLLLILGVFLLAGCYNHIPHKVYKTPQAYSFDTMIPLHWDGKHPVRNWEGEVKLGKPIKAWNGFTYIFELHPTKKGVIIIKTDITKVK